MITEINSVTYEFRGLSSDKKPIEKVGNGSVFFEMDTLKVYMFDQKNKKWLDLGSGEGGGGGGAPSADIIQDLTAITACSLDNVAWESLKDEHYSVYANPVLSGIDPKYEFVNIKILVNGAAQLVKLAKNAANCYAGLMFIEEGQSLYEITVYYNKQKLFFRNAIIY